jgi:hypothetical protein
MKIIMRALIPWLVLGLIIGLTGCAKPPTEEMEAATEALVRAENDPDAVAFAENSLNRARDAIFRMRQESNAKRYDAAQSYAAEAISAAEKAINDGRAAALRAREEAASLMATLNNSLAETQAALENGKRNQLNLDFAALDRELDAAHQTIEQAEAAAAAARTREALEKGQAARAALSDIRVRLSQGVRETAAKK